MLGSSATSRRASWRRGVGTVVALAVVTAGWQGVQAATSQPAGGDSGFAVPDAALVRPLGEVPSGACAPPPAWQACQGSGVPQRTSAFGSIAGSWPMAVPGLGIPLGGVGAGSFMINQSGTFGPWNFGGSQDNNWEMRILPQAALHVREQLSGGPPTVTTLATKGPTATGSQGTVPERSWGSPLPAWHLLQPGQGTYAALYPFGWMHYGGFTSDVSMRFFSPIVAGEDRRTSLPVAYFDVRLANRTAKSDRVSVMFTMPNAPDYVAGTHNDEGSAVGPPSVRTGFHSTHTSADGVDAVTLSADDPTNTPDAQQSEWTIAAKPGSGQQVSFTPSWNGAGDGSDVYTAFTKNGALPNQPLDKSSSAGAIAVSAELAPGQATTIPFALSWDFPQVGFDNNQTTWMRRYTNFYGAKETATNDYVDNSYPFHRSFAIARDALLDHDQALQAVLNWWNPIATDPAYPRELRTAALNQLYQLVFNDSFWEGGVVSNTVVPTGYSSAGPGQHLLADQPGSHLFAIEDGGAGGQANEGRTEDIQSYGYLAMDRLFPNLQRDRLAASVEADLLASNGNAPDLYNVNGDPFITWGNDPTSPIQGGTDSRPAQPGRTQWVDSPSKFIYEWYAYSHYSGDRAFLRAAYPAIKQEISYLQATVPPGTSLPLDPVAPPAFANIYDIVPQLGPGLYDSELYLLALQIGVTAGDELGADPTYVRSLQSALEAAKGQFEQIFWNPVQQYYRFTTAGPYADAVFLDAFFAQHLADQLGLPSLVSPVNHAAELAANYGGLMRYDAAGNPLGAPLLVQPDGLEHPGPQPNPEEASWVWPGANFLAAADYYRTGSQSTDPALRGALHHDATALAGAVATQLWINDANGFAFDPPCGYADNDPAVYAYPSYAHASAIWDVLDAIKPITGA